MFQLTAFHDNFVCDEKPLTNIFAQANAILEKCPANTYARDETSSKILLVEFWWTFMLPISTPPSYLRWKILNNYYFGNSAQIKQRN